MPKYIAMLRGINLGARNRIAMPALKTLVEGLGGREVSTYVQSGNVVLTSSVRSEAKLAADIEATIKGELGLEVAVFVRTAAQMTKIVRSNPFVAAQKDLATLHVTFLADKPAAAKVKALDGKQFGADEYHVTDREVFLHCPAGYGRTKLNNAFFERQLGVAATTRNWKTVTALAAAAS